MLEVEGLMQLDINIPKDQEATIREAWGRELNRVALEALCIEGYRAGKFGSATVGRLLGQESCWQTEQWLAERAIPLNYSLEDLEADRETLDKLFKQQS